MATLTPVSRATNITELSSTFTACHVVATRSSTNQEPTSWTLLAALSFDWLNYLSLFPRISGCFLGCFLSSYSLTFSLLSCESSSQFGLLFRLSFPYRSLCRFSSFPFNPFLLSFIVNTKHASMEWDLTFYAVGFVASGAIKLGLTAIVLEGKVTTRRDGTVPDSAIWGVNKALDR